MVVLPSSLSVMMQPRSSVDAIDIPVTGTKAKERVDVAALRNWIETHHPHHALIERAQVMPKQGASSGFKYGRAVGAIEATVAGCGIPLTILEPRIWKQFHCLRGDNKELSRQRALQLFPNAHTLFTHKKDHGRAEAALIALTAAALSFPSVREACRTHTRQPDETGVNHGAARWVPRVRRYRFSG